ncbi:hypothetical protein BDA99DRAFT_568643 [Phascolomyces articulosus]|uniref:Uncharacterized protein n=1 Tax=Phascolomyces articulosus TaxID=60185 RepID=A0AAD5PIF7_9FUNG|nr:hypothetical protein BDA99DRAFT_568643 [Phascolomyces articulosus]
MATNNYYDDVNLIERTRPPSYEHSIAESRSSFSTYSDSGSSDGEGLPQPPEKMIETNERISTKTLFHTSFLPVFNFLATLGLISGIIVVYIKADGQPVTQSQINIPVPALIALLVSLAVLFIGGGIGYAVSEYKWARFQSTAGKLALLDAYDACSRGVGGAIRAIPALRMDAVLITTVIFYVGTLVIAPAAQGILYARTYDICERDPVNTFLRHMNLSAYGVYNIDASSKDPRSVTGVEDYMGIQLGIRHFFEASPLFISAGCPTDAINCTYTGIHLPYIDFECKQTDLATQQVIDLRNNNVTTAQAYWKNNTSFDGEKKSIPFFLYSGSMYNRTYYDLNNMTFPISLNTETIAFDPAARRGVGDINMVAFTINDTFSSLPGDEAEPYLKVHECTLHPYWNTSDVYMVRGNPDFKMKSSVPVPMDYDNKIGNNVFMASDNRTDTEENILMLNMYAMQLSLARALILDEQNLLTVRYNMSLDQVMHELSDRVSLTFTTEAPHMVLGIQREIIVCKETELLYALDKSHYLPLALCLLVPLFWWTVTWIVSLYKVNGVSRGHSQVALLVSGLSPAARDRMRGTLHENQYATMNAANRVDVKFGERKSDGHPTFGLPQEVDPLGVRRMSF